MDIALQGVKFVIVLAFLVGPVFFTLIQTSAERGFRTGLIMAFGISLSDILYVLVCYFGVAQFVEDPAYHTRMSFMGGFILIAFGLYHFVIKAWKTKAVAGHAAIEKKSYRYFLKGFLINGLSPTVPLFWIGTISLASLDFGYSSGSQLAIFFTSLLCTVLATDILKAYLAGKLQSYMNTRVLRTVNIILGIGLIAFGIRLLLSAK